VGTSGIETRCHPGLSDTCRVISARTGVGTLPSTRRPQRSRAVARYSPCVQGLARGEVPRVLRPNTPIALGPVENRRSNPFTVHRLLNRQWGHRPDRTRGSSDRLLRLTHRGLRKSLFQLAEHLHDTLPQGVLPEGTPRPVPAVSLKAHRTEQPRIRAASMTNAADGSPSSREPPGSQERDSPNEAPGERSLRILPRAR
jgi:hypothetical protein